MREKLSKVGEKIKRMNQLILVFPVWIVLGVSGMFRGKEKNEGWQKSIKNKRYNRMY